jgi:hypothetical protein
MRLALWLNGFGLTRGVIAAFLMAWYPPEVIHLTEQGKKIRASVLPP